ncbi:MAG: DUF2087 domain-containing protein [bacterium]
MTAPTPAEAARQLGPRLDPQGRLMRWPTKLTFQRAAVHYLIAKFEAGREYSEAQVNEVLDYWATFNDAALARRTMIEEHLLSRTTDGARYWVTKDLS